MVPTDFVLTALAVEAGAFLSRADLALKYSRLIPPDKGPPLWRQIINQSRPVRENKSSVPSTRRLFVLIIGPAGNFLRGPHHWRLVLLKQWIQNHPANRVINIGTAGLYTRPDLTDERTRTWLEKYPPGNMGSDLPLISAGDPVPAKKAAWIQDMESTWLRRELGGLGRLWFLKIISDHNQVNLDQPAVAERIRRRIHREGGRWSKILWEAYRSLPDPN